MLLVGCLVLLCTTLGTTLAQNNEGDLCFSKNDSQKLDTLIHLITGVVEIKCNRRNVSTTETCPRPRAIDCADLRAQNVTRSGNYTIYPNNRILNVSALEVYCDMDDEDGGWTVLQRRGNYSNPPDFFYKPWADYKRGFGNVNEDFWLGNDNIFALTNQRAYQLKFVLTDWANVTVNATYNNFFIENESLGYRFSVARGFNGTAGDSFSNRMGLAFSTQDRNAMQCARQFQGAWWYLRDASFCTETNLNGNYWYAQENRRFGGITWCTFRGDYYSLKNTVMKIRPMPYY